MAIYSEFSHEKWWFSIAMLVYQRVSINQDFLNMRFWSESRWNYEACQDRSLGAAQLDDLIALAPL